MRDADSYLLSLDHQRGFIRDDALHSRHEVLSLLGALGGGGNDVLNREFPLQWQWKRSTPAIFNVIHAWPRGPKRREEMSPRHSGKPSSVDRSTPVQVMIVVAAKANLPLTGANGSKGAKGNVAIVNLWIHAEACAGLLLFSHCVHSSYHCCFYAVPRDCFRVDGLTPVIKSFLGPRGRLESMAKLLVVERKCVQEDWILFGNGSVDLVYTLP